MSATFLVGQRVRFGAEKGVVVEALPPRTFRVLLDNGDEAKLPGRFLVPEASGSPLVRDKAIRGPREQQR